MNFSILELIIQQSLPGLSEKDIALSFLLACWHPLDSFLQSLQGRRFRVSGFRG
jgi:hypothetical protein